MPLQVGIEERSRSMAVCVSGLQCCQYSQKKISLITLLSDLVHEISLFYNPLHINTGLVKNELFGRCNHFYHNL